MMSPNILPPNVQAEIKDYRTQITDVMDITVLTLAALDILSKEFAALSDAGYVPAEQAADLADARTLAKAMLQILQRIEDPSHVDGKARNN